MNIEEQRKVLNMNVEVQKAFLQDVLQGIQKVLREKIDNNEAPTALRQFHKWLGQRFQIIADVEASLSI